jgi:hypothetical protein
MAVIMEIAWLNLEFMPWRALITRDGVANIMEEISELLQPIEVVGDGEIDLKKIMELLQGIHGASVYVVEEEALQRSPEHVRRGLAEEDNLHDLWWHRVVKPQHNSLIDLKPLGVMPHGLGVDGAIAMIDDPELAECDTKEGTPHAEVVLDEVEGDWNVSTNSHMFDRRSLDRSRVGGRMINKGIGGVDGAEDRWGWVWRHEEECSERIGSRLSWYHVEDEGRDLYSLTMQFIQWLQQRLKLMGTG